MGITALTLLVAGWQVIGNGDDDYMRRLAITGNVQVENGRVADRGLDAHTKFDFQLQARWNTDVLLLKRGAQYSLRITPTFHQLNSRVRHLLRLPTDDSGTARFRTLLLHEYDHVAISTDERPRVLLSKLVQGLGTFEKPWPDAVVPMEHQLNPIIAAEVEARKAAVVRLINFGYEKLDKLSDHGRRPLPDRTAFAAWLFSVEHLKEAGFGFERESAAAMNSLEMRMAKAYFRR